MSYIIDSTEDLTTDWFTAVLARGGLSGGARVAAVDLEPVGGGVIARMVRASLTYDGAGGPESLVVKYPTSDAGSLGVATAMGLYENEVRFYQEIAPHLGSMSIPGCHYAELDEETGKFVLVLEDLTGSTKPGDVLTASTPEECSRTLAELVSFQAPLWDSPVIRNMSWIADPTRTHNVFDALPQGLQPFLARFGEGLDQEHLTLFETMLPQAGAWVRSWGSPAVVQHGDFRSDNLLFGTAPDVRPITVIDFQTVRLGPPGVDPAYFLGSSLSTAERRETEQSLIKEYHDRLVSEGVGGYDFDSCWTAYRAGAMYGVCLFVGMASQVESSERADRLIVDQIRRYADMALDLDAPKAAGLA